MGNENGSKNKKKKTHEDVMEILLSAPGAKEKFEKEYPEFKRKMGRKYEILKNAN